MPSSIRDVIQRFVNISIENETDTISEYQLSQIIEQARTSVLGFSRKTNRSQRLLVEKALVSLGLVVSNTHSMTKDFSKEGGFCPHFAQSASKREISQKMENVTERECSRAAKKHRSAESVSGKYAFDFTKSLCVEHPTKNFSDFGGINSLKETLRELVEWPLLYPEIYRRLGVSPPKGVLLHGPSGCGKTLLAQVLAGEFSVPLIRISAPEIIGGLSGESEERLRVLFEESKGFAPCILFIDEVDAISTKRESAGKEMERRIVAQFISCMDSINDMDTNTLSVIVIGATSRPDALDPSLRRAGRFDRELELGAPNEEDREQILLSLCKNMSVDLETTDFSYIARRTAGYVGADLASLVTSAATAAVSRIQKELEKTDANYCMHDNAFPVSDEHVACVLIKLEDFEVALRKTQPSSLREGFTTVPDTSWNDIGALEELRDELEMAVLEPIHHPERFEALGLTRPAGVLLYGPPGCGKTLLAKAIARESGANFISIKGPELLNKYVGESERAVRRVFQRGRSSAPCIIFFDELDALAPRRGGFSSDQDLGSFSGSWGASERVVNQLLTELDGVEARSQVFVIAATNRPDMIDPAMLRPGRLDKILFVPLPDSRGRHAILETVARKMPLAPDVSLEYIVSYTKGFSGADLSALTREAATESLRGMRADATVTQIEMEHFQKALKKVRPSVSERDARLYEQMRISFSLYK
eukprot:jgi/Galph1/133/GphlegSOOS_G4844.1